MNNDIINYSNKYVQIIENVFTKEECEDLIKISEEKGFETAGFYVDKYGKEHFFLNKRKSNRCIINDTSLADKILYRIKNLIPREYNNRKLHSVNYKLKFLKYNIGDYFTRHHDGNYISENGSKSQITILIYLNNDYEGAYTTFFKNSEDFNGCIIKPSIGMVCLMDQKIEHEVNALISGTKYVIRTDLMYV
jgi:hypothetical protein